MALTIFQALDVRRYDHQAHTFSISEVRLPLTPAIVQIKKGVTVVWVLFNTDTPRRQSNKVRHRTNANDHSGAVRLNESTHSQLYAAVASFVSE